MTSFCLHRRSNVLGAWPVLVGMPARLLPQHVLFRLLYAKVSFLCLAGRTHLRVPALLSLDALVALRPVKQAGDLPIASQDGGGIHSKPDWSVPPSSASGIFSQLRKDFLTFILQHGLHKRLRDHVAAASDSPFFLL